MAGADTSNGESAKSSPGKYLSADPTVQNSFQSSTPIDLTGSDDEDEDLKRAIALSLMDQDQSMQLSSADNTVTETQPMIIPSPRIDQDPVPHEPLPDPPPKNHSGIWGLDRKKMEAERLARLKRKRGEVEPRDISPPNLRRNLSPALKSPQHLVPIVSRSKPEDSQDRSISVTTVKIRSSSQPDSSIGHGTYPDGKVFLTSMNKNQAHSISFSQLITPTEAKVKLKSVLLSSFIIDFDWLLPHFDTRSVSFMLALHARDGNAQRLLRQDFEGVTNVRLVFPRVDGIINCMHSKLMILFYEPNSNDRIPARCRVVVPSANLVPWDWGIGGVMENILFTIDLPPKDKSVQAQNTEFKNSMVQMLENMGVPEIVVSKLDQYDFSKTAPYKFLHTIGGAHMQPSRNPPLGIRSFISSKDARPSSTAVTQHFSKPLRTGLVGLSDAIRASGLEASHEDTSYPLRLDFVTSSLGNLKQSFLQSLYLAACGSAPEIPISSNDTAKAAMKPSTGIKDGLIIPTMEQIRKYLKIYFPSNDTVQNSKGGPNSAGTICFQSKWWDGANNGFPREMLSDCVGARSDAILMHSKANPAGSKVYERYVRPYEVTTTAKYVNANK